MIGVVVNRNAAASARDPALADRLRAVLRRHGGARDQVIETRSLAELAVAVDRFASAGCEVVASCGGDGTHGQVVTELARRFAPAALPKLVILRGGTVNTVAQSVGQGGAPDVVLESVVARMASGEAPRELGQDTLEVRSDGGDEARCGFLFAAAMGARYLEAYYRGVPLLPRGRGWAVLLASRVTASMLVAGPLARRLFVPVPVRVTADGEELPIEAARLLLAATIPSVGVGFKVTWQGGAQPNRFHLLASALPVPSMALQLHRVLGGQPLQAGGAPHVDRLARDARFEFRAEEPWTLDGELYRSRTVEIRMGPRLWLLQA